MIERLQKNADSLRDHELLEILLFYAIPRKNTNEIAQRLIHKFGSLEGVFSAAEYDLELVEGVGRATSAFLHCLSLCHRRMGEQHLLKRDVATLENLLRILRKRYCRAKVEDVTFFALDEKKRILASQSFTSCKAKSASVSTDEITQFLASCNPSAIIVAHNHIGNSPDPSKEDDDFTAYLYVLLAFHHIALCDHVVVASNGNYFSYFSTGKMEEIQKAYAMQTVMEIRK